MQSFHNFQWIALSRPLDCTGKELFIPLTEVFDDIKVSKLANQLLVLSNS